jgi:zinc D-Ala-D-Ala dipeptidase
MKLVAVRPNQDVIIDLRYSSSNNLLAMPIAEGKIVSLEAAAADGLNDAIRKIAAQNLRLVIWDAYRTPETQEVLKLKIKDERYVRDNSNHTKGLAIDVTLADKDVKYLDMGTDFDEFTPAAHSDSTQVSEYQKSNREKLKSAMESAGFKQWPYEWWHFDYMINT